MLIFTAFANSYLYQSIIGHQVIIIFTIFPFTKLNNTPHVPNLLAHGFDWSHLNANFLPILLFIQRCATQSVLIISRLTVWCVYMVYIVKLQLFIRGEELFSVLWCTVIILWTSCRSIQYFFHCTWYNILILVHSSQCAFANQFYKHGDIVSAPLISNACYIFN